MNQECIRVALAEDKDRLAREIIRRLEKAREIEFSFRAAHGRDLLQRLEKQTPPDVILMDIEMPVMDGITATARVCALYPAVKVIMLTVFDDTDNILRSIQAGAAGYLLKEASRAEMIGGIRQIMNGGAPMSPTIAWKTLRLLRGETATGKGTAGAESSPLSSRETEVLEQICNGLTYQEIATALFIAPSTVRRHIENIYRKLQVNNKAQAIDKARGRRG